MECGGGGVFDFTLSMPDGIRREIQAKLNAALDIEKEGLSDGVLRTLIYWGDADRIDKVLGEKLCGHPVEVDVLKNISSRKDALERLWKIYQNSPPILGNGNVCLCRRWHVGAAMTHLKDKRGIDILLECLTIKNPQKPNSTFFRESVHFTFLYVAAAIGRDFDYPMGENWNSRLNEAIPRMKQSPEWSPGGRKIVKRGIPTSRYQIKNNQFPSKKHRHFCCPLRYSLFIVVRRWNKIS